jgi:hypothetical protein
VGGRLADAGQFFIFADFVGSFALGQLVAKLLEAVKAVLAQEEAVDMIRVVLGQGGHGVVTADRQLIRQFVQHRTFNIAGNGVL